MRATKSQRRSVARAAARTSGTKTRPTSSATFCVGARRAWASSTRRTIRATVPSAEPRVASTRTSPSRFSVAPITSSPGPFVTGSDSPVTIDSSKAERPWRTTPSTGTLSPGRTTTVSPARTSPTAVSTSTPSRTTHARAGLRSRRERSAFDARPRARASSAFPSVTKVTIADPVSK